MSDNMPGSFSSTPPPSSGFLDKMIDNVPIKRLEYLRGKQGAIGNWIKVLGAAILVVVAYANRGTITNFMDTVIDWQTKALYGAGLFVALWLVWTVLSNEDLHRAATGFLDRKIFWLAKWLRTHGDKFMEAEFNISRLQKRKNEADEARSRVQGVYKAVHDEAVNSKKTADEAGAAALGFQSEMERRKSGVRTPPASMKVGQLTDVQLETMYERAKSTLHANYEFWKQQVAREENLGKRCAMLLEVSRATEAKVNDMIERLRLAKRNYELAYQEMQAMQASDDIVNSPEARNFQEALDAIVAETNFFDGRVQMLMDRLDPTVQGYRMKQAAGDIADEDFFRAWLQETKVDVDSQTRQQLLSSPQQPVINEYERLLGYPDRQARSAPVQSRTQMTASTSEFDDLLK